MGSASVMVLPCLFWAIYIPNHLFKEPFSPVYLGVLTLLILSAWTFNMQYLSQFHLWICFYDYLFNIYFPP
jgi:hypothetical protein